MGSKPLRPISWFFASRIICDILGYLKDELICKTIQDSSHPEILERNLNLSEIPGYDNYELIGMVGLLLITKQSIELVISNILAEMGTIDIGYDKHGKELVFYVKDTGVGIPENRQKAIFERFIQAHITDKMAKQGAGLGLSISKAYVDMLGGRIWVDSKHGAGSAFYFSLPSNDLKPAYPGR